MGIHDEVDKITDTKRALEDADAAINYNKRLDKARATMKRLSDRYGFTYRESPERTPEEAEARREEIRAEIEWLAEAKGDEAEMLRRIDDIRKRHRGKSEEEDVGEERSR